MNFLEKIQKLPLATRQLIFWVIIIGLSLSLFGLWIRSFQRKTADLDSEQFKQDFNIPALENELQNLPKEDVEQSLEELKAAIEELEQYEKEQTTTTENPSPQ